MSHSEIKSPLKLLAALLVAVTLTGCAAHEEHEESEAKGSSTLAQAPAPAQESIKKIVGSHKLGDVDAENENGKTTYEAEYKAKSEYSVSVDETGKILELEVEVDPSIIPAAVTDAATKAHPDSKLGEMAITEANGKLFYELDVKAPDKKYEMQITPDGSILSDAIDAD